MILMIVASPVVREYLSKAKLRIGARIPGDATKKEA
jgi:hypothetical protein